MFLKDRNESRAFFCNTWKKYKNGLTLEPVEALISDIILKHPEYHKHLLLDKSFKNTNFDIENNDTNPFLHMGMHIALEEQISSDRPPGIAAIYRKLILKSNSAHDVQHKMMECLGISLWEAHTKKMLPDENKYIECLKKI